MSLDAFREMLAEFFLLNFAEILSLLPSLLNAFILLVLGFLIGRFVQYIFVSLGERLRVKKVWEVLGVEEGLLKAGIQDDPSTLIGRILKGVILLAFGRLAAREVGFTDLEIFIGELITFIPDICIALLIVFFAARYSSTVAKLLGNVLLSEDPQTKAVVAASARGIIIAFGVMAALVQIQIAPDLVQTLFTGFVAMLALAGGLAFGLGSKNLVERILNRITKQQEERGAQKSVSD